MSSPVSWTGIANPIVLLQNADIPNYSTTKTIFINPGSVGVTWSNGTGPPGVSSLNLNATFTQGYKVGYMYAYTVTGSMHADPNCDVWMNTEMTNTTSQTFYTFVPQPTKDVWSWGPDPGSRLQVNGSGIPEAVAYNFFTNNWSSGWYPNNMTWIMYVTILVAQDCTQENIHSQLCIDICSVNPLSCYQDYSNYCLVGSSPQLGLDPICTDYFETFIAANNSRPEIDRAAINYCKKYGGFADLLQHNDKFPDQERARDLPICACFLSASDVPDPNATVLYDRYRDELAKRIPSYASNTIKEKCLVPECASASFLPSDIPAKNGGCPVPKCINSVVINNDGTIGNLDISESCGNEIGIEFAALVIVVLLVIVIVILALYFSNNERGEGPRQTSSPQYSPQYSEQRTMSVT